MVRLRRSAALLVGALIPLSMLTGQPAGAVSADPMTDAFARAATTYDVPRDLLVSLAYSETHLDGHRGQPSASGGYGVMHLVSNPVNHTLERAATLTKQPVSALKADDAANITGGAAVLRAYADELGLDATARKDAGKWYQAVAKYGHASSADVARLYADTVYDQLSQGIRATTPAGETLTATPRTVQPERGDYAKAQELGKTNTLAASVDYPSAAWAPAHSSNYAVSNRPTSDAIDRIVIHVAQGTYAGTIDWFQTGPRPKPTSAHYVVRSSDGAITQMVREKDRAFHAGDYNRRSVGIEHEGWVEQASWFTDTMYRSSAALVRNIADRYGIPKDRSHIIGHVEVPGTDHTDPGPNWNWTKYMQYVTGSGGGTNPNTPESVCGSGFTVIDSAALGTAGTVYLTYNSSTGVNCVATIKQTNLGTATATSAYLEVEDEARITDSGNFSYYAGPVRASAADKCVRWGGKAGTSTYDSPLEHCG
ncbi:N-acetylmuramoyl-L-alanine amidase [Nonomuraea guangzhouensis]|uniref:N-acetylmuramoyl-L-alanine amidase n=1 Tax=Nonomuraea guangzhouensis TaxID=1291555 RepID=A0ABW4G7E3_9ACTN|nr:peptidoglycan recognition family protein [Nonomuraea guangzhouensis]